MLSSPFSSSHQGRHRRRRPWWPATTGGVITAAVAAYGTYHLATWAWKTWLDGGRDKNDDHDDDQEEEGWEKDGMTVRRSRRRGGGGCDDVTLLGPRGYILNQQRQRQRQQIQRYRREARIIRCREEVVQALTDFLPMLRNALERSTDIINEGRELKRLRAAAKLRQAAEERRRQQRQRQLDELEMERGDHGEEDCTDGTEGERERERERELWEIIKTKSATRMIATVYSHTILFLTLTVQVHLLGGKMLQHDEHMEEKKQMEHVHEQRGREDNHDETEQNKEEEVEDSSSSSSSSRTDLDENMMDAYQTSHRMVLKRTYKYFFSRCIPNIVSEVERTAREILADWDVTDSSTMYVTHDVFREWINSIRHVMEGQYDIMGTAGSNRKFQYYHEGSGLSRFIVPPDDDPYFEEHDDELARYILNETWDVLESPVYKSAERECIDVTFDIMEDVGWGPIFQCEEEQVHQQQNGEDERFEAKPLASVITQLRRVANDFFVMPSGTRLGGVHPHPGGNLYVSNIQKVPSVIELGDASFD